MSERRIGDGYHTQKFDGMIEVLAEELVANTMGGYADSPKGREFQRQAVANLKKNFSELPVIFYQTLDAFADGRSVEEYLSCTDPRKKDFLKDVTFADLVMACRDGRVVVKNETAALSYYERLFGPAAEQTDAASATEEDKRRRAVQAGKQRSEAYLCDGRRELAAPRSVWKHAALKGGREKHLGKKLIKLTEKLLLARSALLAEMPLERTGLMTPREQAAYDRLRKNEEGLAEGAAACREELDALSRRQLEAGQISAEAFMTRMEILQGCTNVITLRGEEPGCPEGVPTATPTEAQAAEEPRFGTPAAAAGRKPIDFAAKNIGHAELALPWEVTVSEPTESSEEKKSHTPEPVSQEQGELSLQNCE